jgi:regulator of sigma E protease
MGEEGGTTVDWTWLAFDASLLGNSPSLLEAVVGPLWNVTKVVLGLGFVIFVHELGHFLAAKACGVKVEKFYVGFDFPIRLGPIKLPSRILRFQRGETEYGIGTIPLGGYVRMLGQDDDPRNAQAESNKIRTGPEGELDPRSFPAKPVWQRMIIISAGVVMNLIFAVIMAAVAFGTGVKYTPTLVGTVMPGYPAWNAGIEPGGQIVGIGNIKDDDQLFFNTMREVVFTHGLKSKGQPMPLSMIYANERGSDGGQTGQLKEYSIVPQQRDRAGIRSTIGVAMTYAAELPIKPPALPLTSAWNVLRDPQFAAAKIVTVDDQPLKLDPLSNQRLGDPIMDAQFSRISHPIRMQLELADGKNTKREVIIPPQLEKTVGILWQLGKISGVIPGSPAANAGIQVGDQILKVDGQPIDAFGFWQLLHRTETSMRLTVARKQGEQSQELEFAMMGNGTGQPGMQLGTHDLGVRRWGLAFSPSNAVFGYQGPNAGLLGQGSLESGDQVKKIKVLWPKEGPPEALKDFLPKSLNTGAYEFDPFNSPVEFMSSFQIFPVGTKFEIYVEREGKIVTSLLESFELADQYWPDRGLHLAPLKRTYQVRSFGQAISVGFHETVNKVKSVVDVLYLLVTAKASKDMMAGPIPIVSFAYGEASEGIPQLLLFLTMLSANLAVLNFLPIPVLDGGHMVFLTAELIRGRPVNEQLQFRLTIAGLCGLLMLIVFVFYNDLSRYFGG